MKLNKGQSVHIGRKKFTGEIPDDLAEKHGLTEEKLKLKKKSKPESPKKEIKKDK